MVTHQLQFAQQADRILAINKDVSGMKMKRVAVETESNIEHGIITSSLRELYLVTLFCVFSRTQCKCTCKFRFITCQNSAVTSMCLPLTHLSPSLSSPPPQGEAEAYGSHAELVALGLDPTELVGVVKKEERDEFVYKDSDDAEVNGQETTGGLVM